MQITFWGFIAFKVSVIVVSPYQHASVYSLGFWGFGLEVISFDVMKQTMDIPDSAINLETEI